jgi:hypothetical protein
MLKTLGYRLDVEPAFSPPAVTYGMPLFPKFFAGEASSNEGRLR